MKTLITKDNIESRLGADHKFHAGPDVILTPGARDELRSRGIMIVYGPMPEAFAACRPADAGNGRLEEAVRSCAELLKTRFGIEDPELVRRIISGAVEALRKA